MSYDLIPKVLVFLVIFPAAQQRHRDPTIVALGTTCEVGKILSHRDVGWGHWSDGYAREVWAVAQ